RGYAGDIGCSDALGGPGQDLLGLRSVDRTGVGGAGVGGAGVRGIGVLALLLVRIGRAAVGALSGGTGRIIGLFSGGFAGGGLRLGFRSSLGLDSLRFDAERVGLLLGLLVLRIITDGHGLVLELGLRLGLGLGGDGSLIVGALSRGHHRRGEQATAGSDHCCATAENTGVGVQKFSEFGQWSLDLGICGAAAMLLSCHVFPLVPIGFPGQSPLSVLGFSQRAWRSALAVKSSLRERPQQL